MILNQKPPGVKNILLGQKEERVGDLAVGYLLLTLSCPGRISGTAGCPEVGALALLHEELRYLPRCATKTEWQ
jgi:hypothetical protein